VSASRATLTAILLSVLVAACGESERVDVVEATEANEVVLDGVSYRVQIFRQLNPYEEPNVYRGPPAPADSALYAAFICACAVGGEPARATEAIHLENAFGQRFAALEPEPGTRVAYRPRRLQAGQCIPPPDSLAARTFSGSPLIFRVPLEAAAERPMVLEIRDIDADEKARIVLDL
jgi:hypothetical protein